MRSVKSSNRWWASSRGCDPRRVLRHRHRFAVAIEGSMDNGAGHGSLVLPAREMAEWAK